MSLLTVGLIGIGILFLLLLSRMHIGFVMALVGFLGTIYLLSVDPGLILLGTVPYRTAASYALAALPLFVFMGALASASGLSRDLYSTVYTWLGHLPGGLAMATVGACSGFAAVSGSSVATAATIGAVALPEMKRYKYDPALATGCVACGGTIGILIPPSIILVIYGILTEQSIGRLFVAAIIPGLLEALFYLFTIYILCRRNIKMGPPGPRTSFKEKMVSLKDVWGALLIFLVVIGGIYRGIFTPTEAAAVGAFGVFLIGIGRRRFSRRNLLTSLLETAKITGMIFGILIGAYIFGYFLAVSELPFELAGIAGSLAVNRYIILGLILLVYMILGCVVESFTMIVLTVPIVFPLFIAMGCTCC